jgi:hypothetical protein
MTVDDYLSTTRDSAVHRFEGGLLDAFHRQLTTGIPPMASLCRLRRLLR